MTEDRTVAIQMPDEAQKHEAVDPIPESEEVLDLNEQFCTVEADLPLQISGEERCTGRVLHNDYICNRPKSFLGSDSKELFSKFEIAGKPDSETYLNKYNVIHNDVSSVADFRKEDLVDECIKRICRDIKKSIRRSAGLQ